jgi:hypothetical protein
MAIRTAKQKAALRKAQLASARKRKGKGKFSAKNRRRAKAVGGAVAVGAMMYASYRLKSGRAFHKAASKDHSAKTRRAVASRMRLDDAVSNAERTLARTSRRRGGPPRSQSLEAAGNAFLTHHRWKSKPPKARKGAPRSKSARANNARTNFAVRNMALNDSRRGHTSRNHSLVMGITGLSRHRMADKANRKRGLDGYIPSKAKHDRRRTKAQRKKYPRI